jgi:hypothetical protein
MAIVLDKARFMSATSKASGALSSIDRLKTPPIQKTTLSRFTQFKQTVSDINSFIGKLKSMESADMSKMQAAAGKISEDDATFAKQIQGNTWAMHQQNSVEFN